MHMQRHAEERNQALRPVLDFMLALAGSLSGKAQTQDRKAARDMQRDARYAEQTSERGSYISASRVKSRHRKVCARDRRA